MDEEGKQMMRDADEEHERLTEKHEAEKKDLKDQISIAKFELDKELSLKIM